MSITYYDQPPLDYSLSVIQFKKAYKTLCISLIFQNHQYFISFKAPAGGCRLSGGWAQQELSLDGPPLQSLSVDRGRAGAMLIDVEYDDGDDDDNDDDDDDNDDDDEDDDADDDDDD